MKTLAEFKRALKVGSVWNCIHVLNENRSGDRIVVKVQANSVCFLTQDGTNSWLNFPRASEYEFDNGYVKIYAPACELNDIPRRLLLTYKQVEL
jgi:hypothetical protein